MKIINTVKLIVNAIPEKAYEQASFNKHVIHTPCGAT